MSNWDVCMVYNEMDLLEVRIQELWDVVDKFGIVEMPVTFSGRAKPIYLTENWSRFEKYSSKIERLIADNPPMEGRPWDREHYQREFWGKFPFNDEDIITISDCDEIPHPSVYAAFKPSPATNEIATLYQRMFLYWIDTEIHPSGGNATCAKVCTGRKLKEVGPAFVRHSHEKIKTQLIVKGGWHFTYLGNIDFIRNKIQSFSHCNDASAKKMVEDNDVFRAHDLKIGKIRKVPITADWPSAMTENMDFWKQQMCDR